MRNTIPLPPQKCGPFFNLAGIVRRATLETPAGPLLLHDNCPSSLIESLRADHGLRAFARRPEREHRLLLNIASKPENKLTIAYTPTGDIVGEVTLAPADARWGNTEHIYEVAVEVSEGWRRWGIAHRLLAFALELDTLEQMIIVGMGLSWHWDVEGVGLTMYQYREMMARLFAAYGFSEYLTSEPNIRMSPANIFVARIGKYVDRHILNTFFARLLQSDSLPGL
ncbi:MAG TPA: GNAT family N-acetyltransferase [Ktedonobacteraceae bacterium]|nr:GNAT family N-acetyltransferase [Ktedonobacteraceae bacterium]